MYMIHKLLYNLSGLFDWSNWQYVHFFALIAYDIDRVMQLIYNNFDKVYLNSFHSQVITKNMMLFEMYYYNPTQIARFMRPTWGPPGSCQPQVGPMLAPWTLLSGKFT